MRRVDVRPVAWRVRARRARGPHPTDPPPTRFIEHKEYFRHSGTALSAIELHRLLNDSGREDVSETTLHEVISNFTIF